MKAIFCLIFFLFVRESLCALSLSNTLGDNMVLQRGPQQATIWGTANPNTRVTISVAGSEAVNYWATTSGADGSFVVSLRPYDKGGPYTISANASSGEVVTLRNVFFGDVWVCGGQSNMQFTVHQSFNATEEIAKAANYPQIRVFTVGQNNISTTPEKNLLYITQRWSVASSASIGGPDWSYFSAVCWFFGKDIADSNPGLPIGLISNNWGGTYIQTWMSPDALAKCPSQDFVHTDAPDPNQKSVLWNAMISPFLPNPIAGAIWYQGESNNGQAKLYSCLFPAMITDWRVKWAGSHAFPFYFVQLAPWNNSDTTSIPETREAQLSALALPGVGFATAVDLGDFSSNFGDIHPRDKQDVGLRLSYVARALAYGQKVPYLGPTFYGAKVISQAPNVVIEVSFTAASVESGLVLRPFPTCPVVSTQCAWYSVELSDSKWYNATSSSISPNDNKILRVTLTNVGNNLLVRGLRYGWDSWPMCNLYNGAGLPGIPFQYMFP